MNDAVLHTKAFSDPELCRKLLDQLKRELDAPLRFMEVCGTHTVAIFRSGLRSLLPRSLEHISGPGCPVCVTHEREMAVCMELAGKDGVIIATFGDLMRVPGPEGNLKKAQAAGARIQVVYSPLDALALARENKENQVVFLGIGFETTAPAVAAVVQLAAKECLNNFSVLSFHKLVPPVLQVLLAEETSGREHAHIDAFLLPGHVSTILGMQPYLFIAEVYKKCGVVCGFETADILQSLLVVTRMRKTGKPDIVNQYNRAVSDKGNAHARSILFDVFEPANALWRGIGPIPQSGLSMRKAYAPFDAWQKFALFLPDVPEIKGCKCGEVLRGRMLPNKCPLFGKACTPAEPVGPCMVSTEGSCAAYFTYSVNG